MLHVSAGQLEPGVPHDGGSLQTQQPGVRRQTLHHRRPGRVGEPGPRGEVGSHAAFRQQAAVAVSQKPRSQILRTCR